MFLPLDGRPATRDAALDLLRAAGVSYITPDRDLLGGRDHPADVEPLWKWLDGAVAGGGGSGQTPEAIVASVEMLVFGGLVPSRRNMVPANLVTTRLDRLYALGTRLPLYLSAVVPRTPVGGGGGEDPDYWEAHGDAIRAYMAAMDADAPGGAEILARIPSAVVDALHAHRRGRLLINAELLAAATRGTIRFLLIGQDDATARGFSRLDRLALERLAAVLGASNALLTTGADELGVRLIARWLNDRAGVRPAVGVVYTYPDAAGRIPTYESTPLEVTVREQIEGAGCVPVTGPGDGDILLWVHNFEGERQREARDQAGFALDDRRIEEVLAASADRIVALADVRFANGADDRLVRRLLREPDFAGIPAYAGWNTSSNSLGSAVAQAVVVHHIRRGLLPGNEGAARRMLLARLLNDWGYQAVVRPRLGTLLSASGSPQRLGVARERLRSAAREVFAGEAIPLLEASFGQPVILGEIDFPWDRLFEVAIEVIYGG